MDKLVEAELLKRNCTPTFKGYKGFPGAICLSVNKQLVHGVPSDTKLQDGDVISFDFGATFEGAIADSAITMIYGEANDELSKLNEITRQCLYNAIKIIKVGNRLGTIGHTIYETAKKAGATIINNFGGHGITWNKPHAEPFVANNSIYVHSDHVEIITWRPDEEKLIPRNIYFN